jgi:hypothetical protein
VKHFNSRQESGKQKKIPAFYTGPSTLGAHRCQDLVASAFSREDELQLLELSLYDHGVRVYSPLSQCCCSFLLPVEKKNEVGMAVSG